MPKAGAGATLRRIAWSVHLSEPWQSYLIQEIDISAEGQAISMLVLDTAQYAYRPSAEYGALSAPFAALQMTNVQIAGTHGNILPTQLESLTWLMDAMKKEQRGWICAIHHPYEDLGRHSVSRFDKIRDAGGVPVTLSAHTHDGEFRWHHDDDREGDWMELNVGSMLDAPVEYRNFQVHRVGDRLAVGSRRFVMEDVLREDGLISDDLPGYRPGPGDPDYYMNYRLGWNSSAEASELAIKRVLLTAYLRMFRLFPTDTSDTSGTNWPARVDGIKLDTHEKVIAEIERLAAQSVDDVKIAELIHVLYELRDYDRTRSVPESDRKALRSYCLSQAIWAGLAELEVRGVDPYEVDPDISFVLFPTGVTGAPR
jgi:hypothetical protein